MMSADNSVHSLEEEPENHPLHNDVIFGHILSYVDTPSSRDSSSTLMSMRQVCVKWNERAAPRLFNRLKVIMFTEKDLDFDPINYFHREHEFPEEYLHSVMQQASKISLLHVKNEHWPLVWKICKNDMWSNAQTWIQTYGNKLTGLTLSYLRVEEHVLLALLHNFTPNLETLTLEIVTLKKEEGQGRASRVALRSIRSAAKSSKYLLANLKHLVINYLDYYGDIDADTIQDGGAIKTGMEIVMNANNLQSFTLNSFYFRGICQPLITAITMDREVLKNLRKLKLTYRIDPGEIPLLNQLQLPNLTELDISIPGWMCFGSLFQTIGQQLEKLSLQLLFYSRILEPGIFMPEMKKLKEFHLSYYMDGSCPTAYDARSVINSMPALSVFSVFNNFNNFWNYDYSSNFALERLLETDGDLLPVHSELKKLEISCGFKKPDLVRVVTDAFINLEYLTLWINLDTLNDSLGHLATLEKLRRMKIHLSKSVQDFPPAINTNLANFKSLKELVLMKLAIPVLTTVAVSVGNLHEAHTGFSKCNSLEILSLWNLQIDSTELDRLRKELQKSKPKLAISQH